MKLTFLIHCSDTSGIIHEVTAFLSNLDGNIVYLDQHVDKAAAVFFMRLECEFDTTQNLDRLKELFKASVAKKYRMIWSVHPASEIPRMGIFISKYKHCLYDLLGRHQSGELKVDIPFILSNHTDLEPIAKQFGIPFYHVPVDKNNKSQAETRQLEILKEHSVDFIVLARYMQIVSERLIDTYPNKIINIHHSFLPAFAGAKPYHAAFNRGVKIIGATCHYVTAELDAGPIIEQDVTPVTHTHSVSDFITKGRDLEKIVLARGVQLHLQRKTMVYNNKTVIFT